MDENKGQVEATGEQTVEPKPEEASGEQAGKRPSPAEAKEPKAGTTKKPSGLGGCVQTLLVIALMLGCVGLYVKWQVAEYRLSQRGRNTQQMTMLLLSRVTEALGRAKEAAANHNFGDANSLISDMLSLVQAAVPMQTNDEDRDMLRAVVDQLKRSKEATESPSPGTAEIVQGAAECAKGIQLSQIEATLSVVRQKAIAKNYDKAAKVLNDFASMFTSAQHVEGAASEDWVDKAVAGMGKVQDSINKLSEKSVKDVDSMLGELESQRVASLEASLDSARSGAQAGDYEKAKNFLEQAFMTLEQSQKVAGDEQSRDWVDKALKQLAKAQKAVGDKSEEAVKAIDDLRTTIGTKSGGGQ